MPHSHRAVTSHLNGATNYPSGAVIRLFVVTTNLVLV